MVKDEYDEMNVEIGLICESESIMCKWCMKSKCGLGRIVGRWAAGVSVFGRSVS
jgi:hypothetical protein